MAAEKLNLPETIKGWKLVEPPQIINASNIFDYMDGAGELYLSYHFDCLQVYEYKSDSGNDILVEIYFMEESRDAFGLLSLDWTGEPVGLYSQGEAVVQEAIIPPVHGLYGEGLLRAWIDNLYLRVLASRETPEAKEVILQMGRLVAAGRKYPAPPEMLKLIKPASGSRWELKKDRTAYFYSHLVLNSMYYLSHKNMLNLGRTTEVVFTSFGGKPQKDGEHFPKLILIKYPGRDQAEAALNNFVEIYLPDQKANQKPGSALGQSNFFSVEDGWLGWRWVGRYLALVFGCPDRDSAQNIISLPHLSKK